MPATAMWLPLLVACGVPQPAPKGPGEGVLLVSADVGVFDALDIGTDPPAYQQLWIQNTGSGPLSVAEPRVEGDDAFSVVADAVVLQPSEAYAYAIVFDPRTPFEHVAELVLESDDRRTPVARVDLTGNGIAPVLEVDATSLDFGSVSLPCVQVRSISVGNAGNETLWVVASMAGSSAFDMAYVPTPLEIEPGIHRSIEITYAPKDDIEDAATVGFESTDPIVPYVEIALTATGMPEVVRSDSFVAAALETDAVIVLDNSRSMEVEQAELAASVGSYVDALVARGIDFRIGVITTDQSAFVGGFVTSLTKDATQVLADQITGTGTGGAGTARALQMLYNCVLPGADCAESAGFMRPDALFDVLIVSDGPDQSVLSPDSYVDYLWSTKADDAQIRINAFAGSIPMVSCSTCDTPGFGYDQAQEATGGAFFDVCESDWDANLAWLGDSAITPTAWRFALSEEPVVDTIEVWVDAAPANEATWTYVDVSGPLWVNAVEFDLDAYPSAGADIEVRYTVAAVCD